MINIVRTAPQGRFLQLNMAGNREGAQQVCFQPLS